MVKETCIEVTFSLNGLRVLREAGDAGMVERERERKREREREAGDAGMVSKVTYIAVKETCIEIQVASEARAMHVCASAERDLYSGKRDLHSGKRDLHIHK